MEDRNLKFGDLEREPDIRMLSDMEEVIKDQKWLRHADDMPLYFMYRDLYLERDRKAIRSQDVRYDITVIPPARLGDEYVKTKGHYHENARKGLSYPEIYEVIQGEAHYLMQKKEDNKIKDVIVVKAEAGDKVLIPPNYGHITINPSDETLVMANWVSTRFDSIYADIMDKQGGVYYETISRGFITNPNYVLAPPIRFLDPFEVEEMDIVHDNMMYSMIREPDNLRFLNHPEKFMWVFEPMQN
ncbi:MAG: glucose-6-phosphate isomerase family protein [Candidatus Nanohaloarchaea archaeon]|nr:glucose-6-phosphate isomerase family protein [Candidatus Nanohaloarchaea archaeon]